MTTEVAIRFLPCVLLLWIIILTLLPRHYAFDFSTFVLSFATSVSFFIIANKFTDYFISALWLLSSVFWLLGGLRSFKFHKEISQLINNLKRTVERENHITRLLQENYVPRKKS